MIQYNPGKKDVPCQTNTIFSGGIFMKNKFENECSSKKNQKNPETVSPVYCKICNHEIKEYEIIYLHPENGKLLCQECAKKQNIEDLSTDMYININNSFYEIWTKKSAKEHPNGCFRLFISGEYLYIFHGNLKRNKKAPYEIVEEFYKKYGFFTLKIKDKNWILSVDNFEPDDSDVKMIALALKKIYPYLTEDNFYIIKKYCDNSVCAFSNISESEIKEYRFKESDPEKYYLESYEDYCNYISNDEIYIDDEQENVTDEDMRMITSDNDLKPFSLQEFYGYVKKRIIGNDKEIRKLCYGIWKNYTNLAKNVKYTAENYMITGPSGSGKTEFYRSLRDFFEMKGIRIPVIQLDLSQITESGYKGDNVDTIPKAIIKERPLCGGYAICFLDEADKKMIPSYNSLGVNVNAAVQSNLLTLIEGKKFYIDNDEVDSKCLYDSSKTMFIFMGSFQDIRDKEPPKATGFGRITEQKEKNIYKEITLDDMIEIGMQKELAGRITKVINFHRISEDEIRQIIKINADKLANINNVSIEIKPEAVKELIKISYTDLGIRKPINKISELVDNAIVDFIYDNDSEKYKYKVIIENIKKSHVEIIGSSEKSEGMPA